MNGWGFVGLFIFAPMVVVLLVGGVLIRLAEKGREDTPFHRVLCHLRWIVRPYLWLWWGLIIAVYELVVAFEPIVQRWQERAERKAEERWLSWVESQGG